ncbi:ankryin [Pontibacter sp. SGAir0037]|nr:ankryin [Pontibacter sp. SGAir0037]
MLDSARAEVKPVKEEPVYAKGKIWRTAVMEEAMKLYTGLKYDEAFSKFREAGSYGEGAAFYFIGRMYQYGELRRSAAMPDSPEPSNPELYFIQNDDSAKFYFQQALDHNSLLGNLGFAEYNVVRSEEDKQRFLRLMRSAAVEIRERAVEGDAFCNRILGSMYYTGYGEMKDLEFAFLYLSKAAEKKDVVSYTSLANMYLSGEGVKKDEKKAIEWLQKGVDAGDKEALYTLGLVYEEGLAGTSDSEQARKLYHKAIQKGSAIAFEQLKYLNQTPDQKLVIASFTRNSEMIKKSLTAGAKINTRAVPEGYDQDFRNRTPLMHAVYIPVLLEDFGVIYVPEVRGQAISLLLKNKADVNATDQDGRTALHYTLQGARISTDFFEREQAELLDTLLHYGADPNKVDKQGNAPLYYALLATNGQHEMELGRLLAGGASPNIQNEEGKTVLMLACELKASNEVILRLIQAGANTRMRDNSGKAAIDYTTNEAVINILMAAGSPEARK